jgi:imidazolonepropionase-like amidohydrolase
MGNLVFENVRIFDGNSAALTQGSVRVEENRIAAVSENGASVSTDDAVVIDGGGATLMPGLIDVHTHLGLGSSVEQITPPDNYPAEFASLIEAHCGRVMLDHGFTSGFSGGSASVEGELAAKRAFDCGLMPGPRLVTSSFERVPGGPMGLMFKFEGAEKRKCEPDNVAGFVEEMADLGVQAVKFLLNGVSAFDPGSNMGEQFYDEEILAAGEAAKRKGVWLTAHCYTAHSIKLAIQAGFRTLYHLTYADEESYDLLEANKDKLFIGPAPGIVEADLLRAPMFGVMASEGQVAEQQDAAERVKAMGRELRKRGIRSLPGGDYGFPWNPVGKNARDLELFVEWFGYEPHEVLHAATALGGEAMDMGDELGQIREGFLADILLVDGDPTKDISVLADKDNLRVIMKDGHLHKGG